MPHIHAAVRHVNDGHDRALDLLRRHAGAVSSAVVAACPAGSVEAVFAGGSLAAGRVAWYEGAEFEIYSDIDLYVVLDETQGDAATAVSSAAAAVAPPGNARLLRGVDVGVYTREDLESQPARPGTVGLRDRRVVLHGDESLIADMTGAIAETVAADEGLYLMENRVSELDCDDGGSAAEERLRRYERLKTVLDALTALEIVVGRFDPAGDDRRAAFMALEAEGLVPDDLDRGLVDAALSAARDLQGYLGRDHGVITAEQALLLSLSVWRFGATRLFPDAASDWATLTLRRCHAGAYKDNLREFLAMASGRGRARLRMALPAAGLSRYSAISALRLGALVDAVLTRDLVDDIGRRSLDGFRAYLDRLTGVFGFEDGCLAERVAAMHRAVSGG